MKRFFALDHEAYEPGALPTRTKELLGLVASTVLRCDDCITYHLVRCGEAGWKREEVIDALNVALIVGGSIAIPHVRRAFARMHEIDGPVQGRHSYLASQDGLPRSDRQLQLEVAVIPEGGS